MTKHRTYHERNLLFVIRYNGPWERLSGLCYGLRRDATQRWDIPRNPRGWKRVLAVLGDWCDRRDSIWRAKHLIKQKTPNKRWERTAVSDED